MINEIEVFSAQPDAPELALGALMANDDPIQVRDITGLGPVKAEITSTPLATRGALLQGTSTGARNIVITMGLTPDWTEQTVAALRQQLYRYFVPEQWVKLRFTSDELPTVDIEGYVEGVEPNIFVQDPEIQISILCPKPDFVNPDPTLFDGTVAAAVDWVLVDYDGTIDTGFELRVGADDSDFSGALDITVDQESGIVQLFRMSTVAIDDVNYLRLNTNPGTKRVENVAWFDEATINLLGNVSEVSPDGKWPVIRPGINRIGLVAASLGEVTIPWQLAYYSRFVGF